LNGLQVLSFDGTHDHLISSTFVLQNAHSIYAVAKSDNNGYRRILNGNTDGKFLFGNGNGNNNFATLYGETNWNSTGVITNSPAKSVASPSILIAVSDGTNVTPYHNGTAQNSMSSSMGGAITGVTIGKHATASSQYWDGHIAEIIIFSKNHSNSEREEVEGYLAQKWGLTGSLPSSHSSMSKFKDDSIKSSGKSLDLSNGVFATVPTGGTEDVFDGDSNFSVSTWVKGWPSTAGESIIGKDHFDPGAFGTLKAWLDASNPNYFTKDGGTNPPSAGENFSKWYDLSGNNHHASVASGTPSWESSLLNSKPGADLNGARLTLDGSETGMDGWSQLHAFAVFQFGGTTWQYSFGKTSNVNGASQTAWHFGQRRGDNNPPLVRSWVVNAAGTAYSLENRGTSASLKDNLGLLVISYDGSNFTVRIDGTQWGTRTATGTLQSLPTTPVVLNQGHNMKFGEFIVYSQKLSSADEQKMEGYLAHKWALQGDLPSSGHSYKSAAPSAGWGIQRAATGNDNIALNMVGAGGEFSKAVAVNDNEWHHIVTTYGGGNKKIYIDGVEKATAAQNGSVTASSSK
jgi:hypothetical protein